MHKEFYGFIRTHSKADDKDIEEMMQEKLVLDALMFILHLFEQEQLFLEEHFLKQSLF